MINYDCPTPYQFLLGTVQHLEVMSLLKRQVLQVSIPLRYGTTFAKTISIATTLIVSIPLRYGTTTIELNII